MDRTVVETVNQGGTVVVQVVRVTDGAWLLSPTRREVVWQRPCQGIMEIAQARRIAANLAA